MSIAAFLSFFFLSSLESEQSLSFLAGVLLSDYKEEIKRISSKRILAFSVAAIILGIVALAIKQIPEVREHPSILFDFVQLVIKFSTAIGILFIIRYATKIMNSRFLYFIGIISYECYLLQMPFYSHLQGSLILALIFIALLILASWVFYKFNSWVARMVNPFICK